EARSIRVTARSPTRDLLHEISEMMTRARRFVLAFYLLCVAAMCIVPPWKRLIAKDAFGSAGYRPVWTVGRNDLDTERFLVQLLGLSATCGAVFVVVPWRTVRVASPAA